MRINLKILFFSKLLFFIPLDSIAQYFLFSKNQTKALYNKYALLMLDFKYKISQLNNIDPIVSVNSLISNEITSILKSYIYIFTNTTDNKLLEQSNNISWSKINYLEKIYNTIVNIKYNSFIELNYKRINSSNLSVGFYLIKLEDNVN